MRSGGILRRMYRFCGRNFGNRLIRLACPPALFKIAAWAPTLSVAFNLLALISVREDQPKACITKSRIARMPDQSWRAMSDGSALAAPIFARYASCTEYLSTISPWYCRMPEM